MFSKENNVIQTMYWYIVIEYPIYYDFIILWIWNIRKVITIEWLMIPLCGTMHAAECQRGFSFVPFLPRIEGMGAISW
jgi:hypothetical protein